MPMSTTQPLRNLLQRIPVWLDCHGGQIGRLRWWNTYRDPISGRERWGWCAWWGARLISLDDAVLHTIRTLIRP